jgi:hypothetical protein
MGSHWLTTVFDDSEVKSRHTTTDGTVGPADICAVICVNAQCELVMILNGNISLLHLGLTAEIKMYIKSHFIFWFSL